MTDIEANIDKAFIYEIIFLLLNYFLFTSCLCINVYPRVFGKVFKVTKVVKQRYIGETLVLWTS